MKNKKAEKKEFTGFLAEQREVLLEELEPIYQEACEDRRKKEELFESFFRFFGDNLKSLGEENLTTDISFEIEKLLNSSVKDLIESGQGAIECLYAINEDGRLYYSKFKLRPEGVTQKLYYQKGEECKVLKDGEWVNSRIKVSKDEAFNLIKLGEPLEIIEQMWVDMIRNRQRELDHKKETIVENLDVLLRMIRDERLEKGQLEISEEDVENFFYTPVGNYLKENKRIPLWAYMTPDDSVYISQLLFICTDEDKEEGGKIVVLHFVIRERSGKYSTYFKGNWFNNE